MSFICNNSFTYVLLLFWTSERACERKQEGIRMASCMYHQKEKKKENQEPLVVPCFQPATSNDCLHLFKIFFYLFFLHVQTFSSFTAARPVRPSSKLPVDGSLRRPSMLYDDDRTLVHRYVHARMELLKPTKIRIDGFRIGEDSGFGPFAWQITSPIK